MQTKRCVRCDGDGWMLSDDPYRDIELEFVPCDDCEGTGEIPLEQDDQEGDDNAD